MALVATILSAATATGAGSSKELQDGIKTIQASMSGTGSISATVVIEVSNDNVNWLSESDSTLSLTGTTTASAGLMMSVNWKYLRANVTAISGTGASVNVYVGY
jgi:hypothetical protein